MRSSSVVISNKSILLFFCVLVSLLVFVVSFNWGVRGSAASYSTHKALRYSFLVINSSSEIVENAQFKVFAPVKKNSYQEVLKVSANHDFDLEVDASGNQSLIFTIRKLTPFSREIINITAEIALAKSAQPFEIHGEYLSPEPNIEVDSPKVIALANSLDAEGDSVREAASWINRNIADVGYIAEDRGALYAITNKKGDCTEFSSAFVALARASEIPSRVIGGFVLEHSGKLHAENYHNWSEFARNEAWHIADPQNNIFDSGYGSYIAFYNFNKHSRMTNSHRFLSYDSRLSVQML